MNMVDLIEYKIRNIFLEKSCTKCGGEASPRSFYKKIIEHISESTDWNVINVQVEVYQNILKLRYWLLTFTFYKAFLKNKKKPGTSLPASFSACVLKNNFSHACYNLLTDEISLPDYLYFLRY